MTKRIRTERTPDIGTRARMVAGAADLLRRRGVAATSLREVVRHTRTPRGSLAHHFPQGKAQLLEEAVAYARHRATRRLEAALAGRDVREGLRQFMVEWRAMLESTGFEAGCPIMAVAIDQDVDTGDDGSKPRLRNMVQGAFDEWVTLIADALRREGVARAKARSVAVLVVAAVEGGIAMSRAARDARPLDDVARQLESIVDAAVRVAAPRGARRR
jgi:AcrR family transcriptional regulator